MKFLGKIAEAFFKTDREGRTIFFARGTRRKGYILPDEISKIQIKKAIKRNQIFSSCCVIFIIVLIDLEFLTTLSKIFVIIGIIGILVIADVVYRMTIKRICKNLKLSDEKMTFREHMLHYSFVFNLPWLWLLALISSFFSLGSILMLLSKHDKIIVSLFGFLFFGAGSILHFYLIYLKKKGHSSP